MNRIAVFAHYDKNSIIQNYVIHYLKELKKVVPLIIFVSDCDLTETELRKINDIVHCTIAKKHGEYDFGSYKKGYLYAKESNLLKDCDEFILCNDSCYAPLFPFKDMFETMEAKDIDFWGNTRNPEGFAVEPGRRYVIPWPHIQSYFMAFSKNVFNSDVFDNFMKSIKHENSKDDVIIKYEMGLTPLLEKNDFKYDVYCKNSTSIFSFDDILEKDKSPFIKTSIYRFKNLDLCVLPSYKLIKRYSDYDINLIISDVKANKDLTSIKQHPGAILKIIRRYLIRFSLKHRTITLLGNDYKF